MTSIKERFLRKVNKKSGRFCDQLGTECWEWLASKDLAGYGNFTYALPNKKSRVCRAHRVSCIIFDKLTEVEVASGYVCHTCDWPSCVNPEHLFLGSPEDNMQDKSKKGRARGQAAGSEHSLAKLTDEDIVSIFELNYKGYTTVQIARSFGVDQSAISLILSGKRWSHVETPFRGRVKNNNRFTDDEILEIFTDYSTLKNFSKTAEKWNTVPSVIYNIIKRIKYSHISIPTKLINAVITKGTVWQPALKR